MIIVTHDMGEAFALADRVGVLEEGRLIANERAAAVAASIDPADPPAARRTAGYPA